ncbi:hypothetical protein FKW77_010515 [Venturia effusa]|uniref:Uncharacterized protein n=1 Tax=Venturia effusa TaxID=50376 RepID=A0A517L2F4_9PEZI|nr:hypothetical protein FKW77_010515 [Venturia effusa]
MTKLDLSKNDAKILDAVFDPESSTSSANIEIDPLLPSDPHITDSTLLAALRAQELFAIRRVEHITEFAPSSPRSSMSSDHREEDGPDDKDTPYAEALSILNTIVEEHPTYASVYNNRAQLHRWRYGDKSTLVQPQPHNHAAAVAIANALRDADTAIKLATPVSIPRKVSPSQGRLLAQAWTQRAAICWQAAKNLSMHGWSVVDSQTDALPWQAWDKTNFEEEASRCFHMAGLYGSEVGRAMSVIANPHARLCGNIVKEAMKRERCEV